MSDTPMNKQEETAWLKEAVRDAPTLYKAWVGEVLRIEELSEREPWEDLLIELTVELESTLNKSRHNRALSGYDQFLMDLLQLLVLPNPDDPQGDRNKAVATCCETD